MTGVITFKNAPDFEAPVDSGANNVYDLIATVSDGTLSDTQAVTVTVTGANDAPPKRSMTPSSRRSRRPALVGSRIPRPVDLFKFVVTQWAPI